MAFKKDSEAEITERQKDFILTLIENFDIRTVSKEQASDVITTLSKHQNSYAPCGKHRENDGGRAIHMGDLDWCLHNCDIEVQDCASWNKDLPS